MTQTTCRECKSVFTSNLGGYYGTCSACYNTEKIKRIMEEQVAAQQRNTKNSISPPLRQEAVIYTRFTEEDKKNSTYVRPSEEELQKQKELKRLDILFSILTDSSILVVWAIIWMLTSGWYTFFGFLAAIYVPFYLVKKQSDWRYKNRIYK